MAKFQIPYTVPVQDILTLDPRDWGRAPQSVTRKGTFQLDLEDVLAVETHDTIVAEIRKRTPLNDQQVRGLCYYTLGDPEFIGKID